ncbi:acyltransferase [Saccharomonospora sp. CUA-673]|uniref:carbon-nitrogen hydrolase family protein n=1 Tax=Saccharomonospora sp. CUA-673 TaxID=1904969 RepID=UPI00095988ED|nr:carbon-nitrogen hydrolase family protein [Saccharomonospora sp. CUA-673]OLT45288.1 acyltransferase [Saccharomonospora sp. CUA-673]
MTTHPSTLRVALCQLTSTGDPTSNLDLVRRWTADAAAQGARVVVFPEAMMAHFGVPLAPLAEPLDGPWADAAADIAREHDVLVIAGMFTPDEERVRNTLLITGLGEHRGYDKVHLYDAFGFRESATVAGGNELVAVDVDGVRLGIATCYDVRFPGLFQALAEQDASAVVVAASWGAGDGKREQWELLVRARGLDAGTWILACDQADPAVTGVDVNPKAPTGIGYSTVANPFGVVQAQAGPGPELVVVDIDTEVAEASRRATGAIANRKVR